MANKGWSEELPAGTREKRRDSDRLITLREVYSLNFVLTPEEKARAEKVRLSETVMSRSLTEISEIWPIKIEQGGEWDF